MLTNWNEGINNKLFAYFSIWPIFIQCHSTARIFTLNLWLITPLSIVLKTKFSISESLWSSLFCAFVHRFWPQFLSEWIKNKRWNFLNDWSFDHSLPVRLCESPVYHFCINFIWKLVAQRSGIDSKWILIEKLIITCAVSSSITSANSTSYSGQNVIIPSEIR